MATYVTSDIHGEYDLFIRLLEKIQLKDKDTLYVLGDVVDRGPHPIKTLLKLMEMPNVLCLVGNHELMAIECLEFLMQEITDTALESLDEKMLDNLVTWQYNGSRTTIEEFRQLNRTTQAEIIEYIKNFLIYEELKVSDKDYLLVHGGLGNFYPGKDIEEYSLKELVWDRAEYDITYFSEKYVITGHTPTQDIPGNPNPGYIFKGNNHIALDCGCNRPDGRLAVICLDTMEEYYVERED
ncbi:MAG: metallophosphoesterase family protein [Lachnospiraceae bacterium]|nr:Ser/Thr phosphatase family protein [Lachnospiraceae bacterium oral taxon 082 str. F0431]MDU5598222.1 metallophosphoesterase family protein [Lachnospiraceae bacterium]